MFDSYQCTMIYRWIYQHLHNLEIIHLVHQTFLVCVLQFCSVAQFSKGKAGLGSLNRRSTGTAFPTVDGLRTTHGTQLTAITHTTRVWTAHSCDTWHRCEIRLRMSREICLQFTDFQVLIDFTYALCSLTP